MKRLIFILIIIIIAVAGWLYFIKGYYSVRVRHGVPKSLIYKAEIPGMKGVRIVVDPMTVKSAKVHEMIYNGGFTKAAFRNKEINILAISGGGGNGAYAAGIICGWTDTGERPQFDIVTGVSTGALIAPAAFIGPSYDSVIRDIYTNISDVDIMKQDFFDLFIKGRPSILDTQPLRDVLERVVTKKVLDDVARGHAEGRRLYIATTNLDARRLTIWDMGAIASHGTPEALVLFRKVMLASASIPVAFPPVMFKVKAGGYLHDEMHVDGSVTTQVFGAMLIFGYDEIRKKKTNIYVIRNGKFADLPEEVSYKVWDIAGASFSTLMTWQSYGDISRFYTLARYGKGNFYFSCIPYEFNEPRNSEFDLQYMRKLFYRAYRLALSDNYWAKQKGKIDERRGK